MSTFSRRAYSIMSYDDSEWSEAELMAAGAGQLDNPEDWGAEGMEVYDTMRQVDEALSSSLELS